MEETLKLILNGISEINTKMSSMESDINELKEGQIRLEVKFEGLEKKLDNVVEQTADLVEFRNEVTDTLETIESKIDRTDRDVLNIKTKLRVIK